MFEAYLSEQLVSVIAARSEGTHITLFFVDVNASPHSVPYITS